MLDYLVTSRVRRELLRLVWGENRPGNVSELARAAKVNFSAAHRELEAMLAAGLVATERRGAELRYRQAPGHPEAELLRQLTSTRRKEAPRPTQRQHPDDRVRGWLSYLGAPLYATPPGSAMPAVEEVLTEALVLAHTDATVARVMPLALWRQRHVMNLEQLVERATKRNEAQTLGYFLDGGASWKGALPGESGDASRRPTPSAAAHVLLRASRAACSGRRARAPISTRQAMGLPHECRRRQLPLSLRQVRDGVIVFPRAEIERFLRAVDNALTVPIDLVVIGGTAATLHYGAQRATQDIDTLTAVSSTLAAAATRARAATGLRIPIQIVTIADEPEDYVSRLERVLKDLKRLRLLVPERHDLVLMKSTRAYEHDIQVIREMHQHVLPFSACQSEESTSLRRWHRSCTSS